MTAATTAPLAPWFSLGRLLYGASAAAACNAASSSANAHKPSSSWQSSGVLANTAATPRNRLNPSSNSPATHAYAYTQTPPRQVSIGVRQECCQVPRPDVNPSGRACCVRPNVSPSRKATLTAVRCGTALCQCQCAQCQAARQPIHPLRRRRRRLTCVESSIQVVWVDGHRAPVVAERVARLTELQ